MMNVKESMVFIGSALYSCGFSQIIGLPGALIAHCEEKRHLRAYRILEKNTSGLHCYSLLTDNDRALLVKKFYHQYQIAKCHKLKAAFIMGLSPPVISSVEFVNILRRKGNKSLTGRSFRIMSAAWYGCGFSQIAAIPGALISGLIGLGHKAHAKMIERKFQNITPEVTTHMQKANRFNLITKLFLLGLTPFIGGILFAEGIRDIRKQ